MTRTLVAVNSVPDSENRMHGDEARRYGFSGGLVPGVDVLGYLAHEAVDRWGAGWLGRGRLQGRLVAPVYDGETVEVRTVPAEPDSTAADSAPDSAADSAADGAAADSSVVGPDTQLRAQARLALLVAGASPPVTDLAAIPAAATPDPEDRPAASASSLAPGTVLATQHAGFHADLAPPYLDMLSEFHPAFRQEGLAHPSWLLIFANWALAATVRLGPWIHVSSDAWFLAPVRDGERVEVRGRVRDCFERKGHEMVDMDIVYLVGADPVAYVDHRAIWQPHLASA